MKIQLTQAIYQHTNFSEVFTFFSYFIKKNAIHHVTTAQLTILTYKDLILNVNLIFQSFINYWSISLKI